MSTNFEKVIEFHLAFGLDYNKEFNKTILDDKKLVDLRISLINEEINELFEAFDNKDFTEVRDAIGDIIYVINGMAVSFGFNIDKEYSNFYKNNNNISIFKKVLSMYNDISPYDINQVFKDITPLKEIKLFFDTLKNTILNKNYDDIIHFTILLLNHIYYTGYKFSINVDYDFNLIHESNMSKLCKTEEEAKKTVESYQIKYDLEKSPYDSPTYRLSNNKKYYIVYNLSTGKILKSINYSPVDLTDNTKLLQ